MKYFKINYRKVYQDPITYRVQERCQGCAKIRIKYLPSPNDAIFDIHFRLDDTICWINTVNHPIPDTGKGIISNGIGKLPKLFIKGDKNGYSI